MNSLISRIIESDFITASILVLIPNLVAAVIVFLLVRRVKSPLQYSKRILSTMVVYIIVSNILGVILLSTLNPDHGFYWLDENEGGTWLFTLLPSTVLLSLLFASLFEWKLTR